MWDMTNKMKKPIFISLEGIEGSGKTTQMEKVASFLEERGLDVVITREPGGTEIGYEIRKILLNAQHGKMADMTELLLFLADRAQHIEEIIRPALQAGKTVLCDRYYDATVAYQSASRGIDEGLIAQLHQTLFQNLLPDVTFLFDLDPKVGLERAWSRIHANQDEKEARFEKERETFHENVRAGYLKLAQRDPDRFVILDAAMPEETVFEEIKTALTQKLDI